MTCLVSRLALCLRADDLPGSASGWPR